MKNTRNAFTLVELIVVITILAILGTIAFISLQGYSADARNSKRTSDLNNLVKSIQIKVANGSPLIGFVKADAAVNDGAVSVAGANVKKTNDIDYQAGTPNYSSIGVKGANFRDPSADQEYSMGVTTKKSGQYEFAASMEDASGTRVAFINGIYNARTAEELTPKSPLAVGSTRIILKDEDTNKIRRLDTIKLMDSTKANFQEVTVDKVSPDGRTITISTAVNSTHIYATLELAAPESASLMSVRTAVGGGNNTDLVGGSNVPY